MKLFSIKGPVIFIQRDYVVVVNNDIGICIYVSNPQSYTRLETYTFYLYDYKREDDTYLVGFPTLEEKDVFSKLITVKGIGPKTALQILGNVSSEELDNAIMANNITFLRKIPGVGPKAAAQILLDLRGNYQDIHTSVNVNQYDEVRAALRALKFKPKEIENCLVGLNLKNATNEELIKEALKRLQNRNVSLT